MKLTIDVKWPQLDRIETTLERMETRMSQQEQDLNAALDEQKAKLDNLVGDVHRLIAAVEALPEVDLSDEIAKVKNQIAVTTGASDDADATVPEAPAA